MLLGTDTVTFIVQTPTGAPNELGTRTLVPTPVAVDHCRFRPLSATEAAETMTNVATQIWKCTAPPEAAAVAAKSTGLLQVDGVTYKIIGGAKPYNDRHGRPFKVTILCQVQHG
jgi:hypothetical protein